jgi:hypothetical protein
MTKLSYMLETPKAYCTLRTTFDMILLNMFGRENQEDETMDNQQERFGFDLAWLAGIIEGEGWISLSIISSQQPDKRLYPAFLPSIGVTNTDFTMIAKIEEIFKVLELKYVSQFRNKFVGKDGSTRKPKIELSIRAKKDVVKLANSILPFMHGEKKNRIHKIFEYYKIRESKPRSGKDSKSGKEEYEIYKSLYSFRGKTRSKILNDFMLRLESNEQDKV